MILLESLGEPDLSPLSVSSLMELVEELCDRDATSCILRIQTNTCQLRGRKAKINQTSQPQLFFARKTEKLPPGEIRTPHTHLINFVPRSSDLR